MCCRCAEAKPLYATGPPDRRPVFFRVIMRPGPYHLYMRSICATGGRVVITGQYTGKSVAAFLPFVHCRYCRSVVVLQYTVSCVLYYFFDLHSKLHQYLNGAIVLMNAAVSRAGTVFSEIMGRPWWLAHDFRGAGVIRMAADCAHKIARLR
jgi:hypothetical protein